MTATPSFSYEPPDAELQDLAKTVNNRARTGRVTFYGTRLEDGVHWSVIFQDGPKRATIHLRNRPTEDEADEIILALEAWAGFKVDGSPYTVEVPKPPASEWS